MPADAVQALEPLLGPPESEPVPLEGGITNRNYRVRWGGRECVLRLPGKDTGLLGIDREAELAATQAAAAPGIGPEVVAFEPERGCLVTAFIEGRPLSAEELRGRIPELAETLRAVHAGGRLPAAFSSFEIVERYRRTAEAHGGSAPAGFDDLLAGARAIEAALDGPDAAPVPCHNDLLTANFLDDGRRIRIVDWEYAGMGDRRFDLGNLSVNNDFGEEDDRRLLEAYFEGGCTPARIAALRLMRIMSDFREGMWGVVQGAVSELDFDFGDYAARHLERVRAALADPRCATWLDEARAG